MISMWKVREMMDKATNLVMNYTDTEAKVRDATNDDPWGPSGQQMQEVATFTFTYEQFPEAMGMLWKRMLVDNHTNWRRTYKSLLLLDYLLKNGSERVVTSAREHVYDLKTLENYSFVDENGKDQGVNIRHKVTDLADFIQDDDRLRDERKKAKKNKDKYIGMSSDAMGFRGSAGGFDSGWTEKWPSSSGPTGPAGPRSGFRDHSPDLDEDPYRENRIPSDVDEFKDDELDDFPPGGLATQRPPVSPGLPVTQAPSPTKVSPMGLPVSGLAQSTKVARVRKPIDLGAAASYAKSAGLVGAVPARPAPVTAVAPKNTQLLDDLFGAEDPTAGANGGGYQSLPTSTSDVMSNKDLFDARPSAATASSGLSAYGTGMDSNANGDFGDFSSAFNSGAQTTETKDDFADFSSAFNASDNHVAPVAASNDLFASLPLAQSGPQTAGLPNVDLMMSGGGIGGAAPSSNAMDLLGGLDFNTGGSQPTSNSRPQPTNNIGLSGSNLGMQAGFGGNMMGPSSMPPLIQAGGGSLAPNVLQPHNSTTVTVGSNNNHPTFKSDHQDGGSSKIMPERWGNVGSLNIDLDNLSLAGRNQPKKSVPMNAMKSSSSSESPGSPLGFPSGSLVSPTQPSQNNYLDDNRPSADLL
eukprot:maker-scaffold619_size123246-snap-gene-0.30 protein:Tk05491 transcript:maker-scaffold619_size123246-snap-gene-0.30-mRNA-1 annotation:"clathrin interactor 1-like"